MHNHNSLCRFLSFLVSLILSLTAIAVGLLALNINVLNLEFVSANLSQFIMPAYFVIGIAGLIALLYILTGFSCAAERGKIDCRKCRGCDTSHSK